MVYDNFLPENDFVETSFSNPDICTVNSPDIYINTNIVKYGNIYVSEYSLGNIIFRINLILTRTNVSFSYDSNEFKWNCYLFIRGRYCKFSIKIFSNNNSESTNTYLIDMEKTLDSGFIYRNFVNKFRGYFENILSIPIKTKIIDHEFLIANSTVIETMIPIYMMGLDELSSTRSKDESISCMEFLLEILEYKALHSYGIKSGIHIKLCYLLMELEYDKDDVYEIIDTVLYLIYLLTLSPEGKTEINKCKSLIDFLNKKIHQDLLPYEIYTLELAHLILKNLA